MRILVTWGAGFIGSHIVDTYITQGHYVVILDDLSFGFEKNINIYFWEWEKIPRLSGGDFSLTLWGQVVRWLIYAILSNNISFKV